jgi:predicted ATPase
LKEPILPVSADPPLEFGRIRIQPAERTVRVDGLEVALGARAFDVLLALAQRRDRLVTRQELLDLVWPGLVVEEHNVTAQISTLRKLLGAQTVATVPGRGYRFVAPAAAPAPTSAATPPRHNLPPQRTRFIGRDSALANLQQLLAHTRLLTLTGIGGSGKTRLALECARRLLDDHADGVWFIDLAPLSAPERVAFACASVFGLGDDAEAALLERLGAHLAERQALVVLDNCEHVRDAAAALADALLSRAGGARVLATSRVPLGLGGEQRYAVHPLSLPATDALDDVRAADAPRLFVDRARLAVPAFELDTGNAGAVAELCRGLDGIALAIELAAARVPLLSVADITTRLRDRFRLLTRGATADARQQTLAAVIQWSYDQLAPAEQRTLRLLSVCADGCSLEAAAALAECADEYAALTWLTSLYERSLLVVDSVGAPRYRLLETVRLYARERLDECGETDAALARHTAYFVAFAEAASPQQNGPQESQWMERLHAERGNLAAALGWCAEPQSAADPSWAVRLAAATGKYWLFNEVELGCRLVQAALARDAGATGGAVRFHALRVLAGMHMHRGQGEQGLPHARAALALAQRAGEVEWQAMALNAIGTCLGRAGEEAEVRQHYERALELAQAGGGAAILSAVLNNLAVLDFRHGRYGPAEDGFRQGLRLARGQGHVRAAAIYLHNLVRVLVIGGKPADAHACAVEAEALLRGVAEDVLKLELLEVSAGLASIRGEHDVAARFWGFACRRYVDQGYRRPIEDEAQLVQLSTASRRALGDAAFDAAEAAGRALDLPAAMQELRHWLDIGPV